MLYFKKEDFDLCMEFLADKPDTVETQQGLYKFMQEERHIVPDFAPITVKNMQIYSKVYAARFKPGVANWCSTMSDGSQVVWNKNYQAFYKIKPGSMVDRCDCFSYLDMFPELKNIDKWLLENWSNWCFKETQKQLVAIFNGTFSQHYVNVWK